jgi:hypothetical protein
MARRWLASVLRRHYDYSLPSKLDRLGAFYKEVRRVWCRAPRRRSQPRLTWKSCTRLLERFALPTSHVTQARTGVALLTRRTSGRAECEQDARSDP